MLRNYFDTIPASLEEAAAIDGCTRLQAMRHVSLPLALPAIASNALFVFMIAWNEFLFALLFLVERRENWTVSLGLSQLAGSIEVPTTVLMAGSVILTRADHRAVLPQRALAGRWPDRGRREGLTPGPRPDPDNPGGHPCPRSSRSPRPHDVALVACEPQPLVPGSVRVRTWYSGISAGTELTAYRGSNPYLTRTWDAERRLFVDGEPTFAYPVAGLGLLRGRRGRRGGRRRRGARGRGRGARHLGPPQRGGGPGRDAVRDRVWTADDAISGTFARVGSIALNAVLAAEARLGDRVAVFGQGVIGLLATRLAALERRRGGRRRHAVPERLDGGPRAWAPSRSWPPTVDGGRRRRRPGLVGRRRGRRHRAQRQRPGPARGGPLGRGRRHRRGLRLLPGRRASTCGSARSSTTTGSGSWPARSPARRSRLGPALGPAAAGAHLHGPGPPRPGRRRARWSPTSSTPPTWRRSSSGSTAATPTILQAVLRFPAAPE